MATHVVSPHQFSLFDASSFPRRRSFDGPPMTIGQERRETEEVALQRQQQQGAMEAQYGRGNY